MKRRTFLQSSLATAALFSIVPRRVLGRGFVAPSDRITLGVIGTGKQSHGLTSQFIKLDECRVIAACDVYKGKLDRFIRETDRRYRSEEHTSELQSLMRISYAVFCLKKKNRLKAK